MHSALRLAPLSLAVLAVAGWMLFPDTPPDKMSVNPYNAAVAGAAMCRKQIAEIEETYDTPSNWKDKTLDELTRQLAHYEQEAARLKGGNP